MRNRFIRGAAALAAALVLAAGAAAGAAEKIKEKFQPGDKAPDFALRDLGGAEVKLSDYAGKQVVLLAFWALRCGVCREETPHLERLHATYGDKGLAVLGVNTDGVDAKTAAEVMKELGIAVSYRILLDPDSAASDAYTNYVVPLTIVVDRQGIVRFIHTGFEKGMEKEYEEAVLKVLGP